MAATVDLYHQVLFEVFNSYPNVIFFAKCSLKMSILARPLI